MRGGKAPSLFYSLSSRENSWTIQCTRLERGRGEVFILQPNAKSTYNNITCVICYFHLE